MKKRTLALLVVLALAVIAGTVLRLSMIREDERRVARPIILLDGPEYAVSGDAEFLVAVDAASDDETTTPAKTSSSSPRRVKGGAGGAPQSSKIASGVRPMSGTPGDMSEDLAEMERERQKRAAKALEEIKRAAEEKREPSIFDPTW